MNPTYTFQLASDEEVHEKIYATVRARTLDSAFEKANDAIGAKTVWKLVSFYQDL